MFQKDMVVSVLLDFYGELLSERRREIMEMYYNEDFSLSEIADETGISRQGVRDSIKKGENELSTYEEKLGLLKRFTAMRREISKISVEVDALSDMIENPELSASLQNIGERLRKLDI